MNIENEKKYSNSTLACKDVLTIAGIIEAIYEEIMTDLKNSIKHTVDQ